jgi:aspartate kinase
MADERTMNICANVANDRGSNIIVLSATYGTTNQLEKVAKLAQTKEWDLVEEQVFEIIKRHTELWLKLSITKQTPEELTNLFSELSTLAKGMTLLKECSPRAMDQLYSIGERLSSTIFSKLFAHVHPDKNVEFLDARTIIKTDDSHGHAAPNFSSIKECSNELVEKIKEGTIYITQGFIGSTENGVTSTLGRGGSDYSAALFAWAVCADVLEIWTDVEGIATTDPRICPAAKRIHEISFQEASELANFGAKILHPATLAPALKENIPVYVGSSFNHKSPGTWIVKDCDSTPLIRALAIRRNQILLTIKTPQMLHAHGFLYQIFSVFNKHQISVDNVTTSEISVSITLDDGTQLNKKLISELKELGEVVIEEGLSLVSIIGNRVNHTSGLGLQLFSGLGDINIRMICSGSSKHHLCFLVSESMGEKAIMRLHETFIEGAND